MLTKKDYSKLKKDIHQLLFNHTQGGFVIEMNFDVNVICLDYYEFCIVWHYYICQLLEFEDFETCLLIRQIILEEKKEVIINMYLAGIYEVGIDDYLDTIEELARKKQGENKFNENREN